MATRAQRFRHEQERTKPPKSPAVKRHKKPVTDDAGARHLSAHGARKANVATEESHSGRPSRKSTRGSANKGKNSQMLEYAQHAKLNQPESRHFRRG